MCAFVKRPEAGSPESLCCCFHSLCAGPGVHTGSPVQPVLCSGLNPPALLGSTRLDWTWKTHTLTNTFNLSFWIKMSLQTLPSVDIWYFDFDLCIIYLDIVTSVGLGRAFRNSCTAEMSLSISSSVLMWWGSSTESHVNPAWCTWERTDGDRRRVEAEKNQTGRKKRIHAFTYIHNLANTHMHKHSLYAKFCLLGHTHCGCQRVGTFLWTDRPTNKTRPESEPFHFILVIYAFTFERHFIIMFHSHT